MNMLPTIVIVGRRNVGKSALFNRLIEEEKAIVSDIAGTTRDRTEGICRWRGERLRVVDTGGLDIGKADIIDREVTRQANFAMREADLIIFLVDARVDPQSADKQLARKLRYLLRHSEHSEESRGSKNGILRRAAPQDDYVKVLLVANKAETAHLRGEAQNPKWKNLGFDIPLPISAMTGQGVGDLLDEIFSTLPALRHSERSEESRGSRNGIPSASSGQALRHSATQDDEKVADLKIAIIGKPNVGKSSLLNKILGEERVIVSPTAHTTREPQDTLLRYMLHATCYMLLLIDTAGIRRKARITPGIEQAGVSKTLHVIEKSDVVLFLIDGTQPLDSQDKRLAGMIEEKGVGVVVVVNKWDILGMKNEEFRMKNGTIPPLKVRGAGGVMNRTAKQGDLLLKQIHFGLPGLTFAPVIFVSALTGHNVDKILPAALSAQAARQRTIPDEELAALLPKLIKRHKPVRAKGNTKFPIIRRLTQVASAPPAFVAWIGPKQSLHQTYLRFIENQLRSYFDFEGTPLRVFARQERK